MPEAVKIKNVIARTFYKPQERPSDDLLAFAEDAQTRVLDPDDFSPLQWWVGQMKEMPTLAAYALDLLCCPAMSAECERVFSGAKLMLTPNRNALACETLEACECLRVWWMRGIISEE